jgi:hypothetical protein
MAYAILRTAKLKSMGGIGGSLAHTYRTRETPNADAQRNHLNEHYGPGDPEAIREAIRARLPDKRRKDAVLCLEYFVGASPEFFQGKQDGAGYFAAAVDWLERRHGAENVVAWSVHRDETSPHLVAYVVPLDEAGKLNAKRFTGGKAVLSRMQTDFAEACGRPFGLQRGIEGSKATHTTVREHYGALNAPDFKHGRLSPELVAPQVLEKRLFTSTVETPEQVAKRLTKAVKAYYDPAVKQAAAAALARRRAQEMATTAQTKAGALAEAQAQLLEAQREAAELRARFVDGLTPEQQQALADQAVEQRRGNWLAAEARRRAEALQELAKRAAGAVQVFARRGVAAIEEAAGRWRAVDGGQGERATVREAVHGQGETMVDTVRALLEHSPGHAGTTPEQAAEILRQVAEREPSPQRRQDRSRDYEPEPW